MAIVTFEMTGSEAVAAYFEAATGEVEKRLQAGIGKLVLRLQGKIKRDKLSGQVLKRKSGTLSRSIGQSVQRTNGTIVGTVQTNVVYAAIHEYGFDGTQSVPESLRLMKKAWGKTMKNPRQVRVRAHSRKVNYPERSFMRTALADMEADIKETLENAVLEGLA